MQYTLDGRTIDEVAIDRIRAFCPPEGYYLAFSGGKDSTTLYDLAVRAQVPFDSHFHLTTVDPPELVYHVKRLYPQVSISKPPETMWQLCRRKKMLPLRTRRFCCEKLKEIGGRGRYVLTGIRWAESSRRAGRKMAERSRADASKTFIHPIIDWSDKDVWGYIHERGLPYCSLYDEGFDRLGCVLCPMAPEHRIAGDIQRWPKIAAAWRSTANAIHEIRLAKGLKLYFPDGDTYFEWWLSRHALPAEPVTYQDCLVPFSD